MRPARVRLEEDAAQAIRGALAARGAPPLAPEARLASAGPALRRRLGKTGTVLLQYGFGLDAVGAVLGSLLEGGMEPTEAAALDWLCLSTAFPLPPGFAVARQVVVSGEVTLLARQEGGAAAALRVVAPELPPPVEAGDAGDAAALPGAGESKDDIKRWILAQVQTGSDDEEEGDWESRAAAPPPAAAQQQASRADIAAEHERRQREALTEPAALGLELRKARLAAKQGKQAKDAAAQKAAGEVMRQLREVIARLGLSEEACTAAAPDDEPPTSQPQPPADDGALGGGGMFDEPEGDGRGGGARVAVPTRPSAPRAPAAPAKPKPGAARLAKPTVAVALQLPKAMLQQHCQRQGWGAPRFERRPCQDAGCFAYAVHVETLAGRLRQLRTFEPPGAGPRASVDEAQNAASTAALAALLPSQWLAGTLAPPYASLWEVLAQEEAARERAASDADRLAVVVEALLKKAQPGSGRAHAGGGGGGDDDAAGDGCDDAPGAHQHQHRRRGGEGRPVGAEAESRAQAGLMAALEAREARLADVQAARAALPIAQVRAAIDAALRSGDALVVCGETGCGKSTQGASCNVLVTQPRRVAAMSLADRVAYERGEAAPGAPGAQTGYQVRADAARTHATRLLFLTTGVLLRRLHGDGALDGVSHVVVDEVHERSLDADLALTVLLAARQRRRAAGLPPLKLVLMSATLDAALFSTYLGGCPVVTAQGRMFPVETLYLEDVYHTLNYLLPPDSPAALRGPRGGGGRRAGGGASKPAAARVGDAKEARLLREGWGDDEAGSESLNPSYDPAEYEGLCERARKSLARVNEERIDYDLLEELLAHVHATGGPGSVLVFLPGVREINTLHARLAATRWAAQGDALVLPLHSALGAAEQRRVFQPGRPGTRKIVLATNIAETSVTLDGCAFVVDTGRQRAKHFITRRGLSSLEEEWVSRANAKQRCGRAGRVRAGTCYALYTRRTASSLRVSQAPEITRTPLVQAALHLARMRLGASVADVFERAPTPPEPGAVALALAQLRAAGAMVDDDSEALTPLGELLASLPVDVQSGKALLLGALLGCARHALTLSAAMCAAKSPFAALAAGDRDAADRVRLAMASPAAKGLAAGALCDPLLVVDAYEGWRAALQSGGPRAAAQHCRLAFLDPDVLAVLHDTRGQLAQLLCAAGWFGGDAAAADAPHSPWNRSPVPPAQLLRDAVLCGALASQVAAGSPDDGGGGGDGGRSVWAVPGLGDVCVHPSSALHGVRSLARATPFLLYLEANKTHAVFVRDVSAVSPAGLALFGPPLALQHAQGAATLGPSGAAAGLRLAVDAQTGVLLKALRGLLERGLAQCLASRAPQPLDQDLLRAVAAVLRDNPVPVV